MCYLGTLAFYLAAFRSHYLAFRMDGVSDTQRDRRKSPQVITVAPKHKDRLKIDVV